MEQAKKYLEQKVEPSGLTHAEIKRQYPHWFHPIGGEIISADALKKLNYHEVEEGNLKVRLFTDSLSESDLNFLDSDRKYYRKLVDLVFDFDGGEKISIKEILPKKDTLIIFSPATRNFNADVSWTKDSNRTPVITLEMSPLYPNSILSLIHEIGHTYDLQEYAKLKSLFGAIEQFKDNNPTEEAGRIILEAERNAWAFALKFCKKIFKSMGDKFTEEEMFTIIHGGSLNSYSSAIMNKLAQKQT